MKLRGLSLLGIINYWMQLIAKSFPAADSGLIAVACETVILHRVTATISYNQWHTRSSEIYNADVIRHGSVSVFEVRFCVGLWNDADLAVQVSDGRTNGG